MPEARATFNWIGNAYARQLKNHPPLAGGSVKDNHNYTNKVQGDTTFCLLHKFAPLRKMRLGHFRKPESSIRRSSLQSMGWHPKKMSLFRITGRKALNTISAFPKIVSTELSNIGQHFLVNIFF